MLRPELSAQPFAVIRDATTSTSLSRSALEEIRQFAGGRQACKRSLHARDIRSLWTAACSTFQHRTLRLGDLGRIYFGADGQRDIKNQLVHLGHVSFRFVIRGPSSTLNCSSISWVQEPVLLVATSCTRFQACGCAKTCA